MGTQNELIETRSRPGSVRLYYLDWLRVLAIFLVFLFHAVHPFDYNDWQIKNADQSEIITIILMLVFLWGMPFFFLVAGASSWFALQRRTSNQYVSERFKRLFIPFLAGLILFSPIQFYLEWLNKVQLGMQPISFQEYIAVEIPAFKPLMLRYPGFSPWWLGFGFHLWFIAFLFFFALFTLPLFRWLKAEKGESLVSRLAGFSERRGGLLVFILPLVLVQLIIRPHFPEEHDWGDFIYLMCFFILGFILYADGRFTNAVRKDWWILLAAGTVVVLVLLGMYALDLPVVTWALTPAMPQFLLVHSLIAVVAFSYSLVILFIGMRFLDFTNARLVYAQEAVLPFFVLHQPAIVIIAFFVVQWAAGIPLKMTVVVVGSFLVCMALYELIIRRIRPLRAIFGMKSKPAKTAGLESTKARVA